MEFIDKKNIRHTPRQVRPVLPPQATTVCGERLDLSKKATANAQTTDCPKCAAGVASAKTAAAAITARR